MIGRKEKHLLVGLLVLIALALSMAIISRMRDIPAREGGEQSSETPAGTAVFPNVTSPPAPVAVEESGADLATTGVFNVYVLGREGVPLAGVTLAAVPVIRGVAGDGEAVVRVEGATDARGECALAGLPWGKYAITAVQGSLAGRVEASLDEIRKAASIKLVLKPAGTICGRVTDTHDLPLVGAEVALLSDYRGHGVPAAIETNATGEFCFTDVPLGQYRIQAEAVEFAPQMSPAVGIDEPPLTIRLTRGGSLAMVVLEESTHHPVPNVPLDIRFPDIEGWAASIVSDAVGKLALSGLPAGRCLVQASDSRYVLEPLEVELEIAEGRTLTGELVVKESASISGLVVDSVTGKPVAGLMLAARDVPARTRRWVSELTGPDGIYAIRGLSPGRCEVELDTLPRPYLTPLSGKQAEVELEPGEVRSDVDFALDMRGEGVEGVVLDESGAPVAGARVRLHAYRRQSESPERGRSAFTDASGHFYFDALDFLAGVFDQDSGSMHIVEEDLPIGVSLQANFRGAVSEDTGRMELPPGGLRLTLELGSRGGASIAGLIINERGVPVVAELYIERNDEGKSVGNALTTSDVDGFFIFSDLQDGTYTISASSYSESGGGHALRPLQEVRLSAGQHVNNLRLILKDGLTIRGRLIDSVGKPVKNYMIYATHTMDISNQTQTSTDADGYFEMKNLEDGGYSLDFHSGLPLSGESERPPVVVAAGDEDVEVVWDIPPTSVEEPIDGSTTGTDSDEGTILQGADVDQAE